MKVIASPLPTETGNAYFENLYAAVGRREPLELSALSRRSLLKAPDVVHINFLEFVVNRSSPLKFFLSATTLLACLSVARLRGSKIIWTVHNVVPHEQKLWRVYQVYVRIFVSLISSATVMSQSAKELVVRQWPSLLRVPIAVIPHGSYGGSPATISEKLELRTHLSLEADEFIVLCFGQFRAYKRLPEIADAFVGAERGDNVRLLIVGAARDESVSSELQNLCDRRIDLRVGHVSEPEMFAYMRSSDVLLQAHNIPNSGVIVAALECHMQVVVPAGEPIRELQREVGVSGWINTYEGAIEQAVALALNLPPRPDASPDLSIFDWDNIGDQMLKVFKAKEGAK